VRAGTLEREEREVIRFGWRVRCWAHLRYKPFRLGGPSKVLSIQTLSLPFLLPVFSRASALRIAAGGGARVGRPTSAARGARNGEIL
jgi:hypothetical protein